MTTFVDGPAHGKTLMLHRAALFLRVVVNAKGDIDGLDQPDDEPKKDELIFLYVITKQPGHMHINARGGRGGFYPIAEYRYVAEQPADADMRTKAKWHTWVEANHSRYQIPEA